MIAQLDSLLSTSSGIFILLGATFIVALLESLAVVGLILPGVALLFMLSAAAAQYDVGFFSLALAGFLGGFLGDSLSFRFGQSALSYPWAKLFLAKHDQLQQKAHALCTRYGIAALLIGRFIGPLRPFVPMTAGILDYPKSRFYPTAILGSCAWAPFYLGPGYFLGYQPSLSIAPFILLSCIAVTPFLLHLLFINAKHLRLVTTLCFFAIGFWLLGEKAQLTPITPLADINLWVKGFFESKTLLPEVLQSVAINLATALSVSGNTLVVALLSLSLAIYWIRNAQYPRILWLIASLSAPFIFKALFDLDRPSSDHQEITQSYPSGHTYFSFLFAMLFQNPKKSFSTNAKLLQSSHYYLGILMFIWAGSVALSRLVLHVHWLTDLVGGWLLAAALYSLIPPLKSPPLKTVRTKQQDVHQKMPPDEAANKDHQ